MLFEIKFSYNKKSIITIIKGGDLIARSTSIYLLFSLLLLHESLFGQMTTNTQRNLVTTGTVSSLNLKQLVYAQIKAFSNIPKEKVALFESIKKAYETKRYIGSWHLQNNVKIPPYIMDELRGYLKQIIENSWARITVPSI